MGLKQVWSYLRCRPVNKLPHTRRVGCVCLAKANCTDFASAGSPLEPLAVCAPPSSPFSCGESGPFSPPARNVFALSLTVCVFSPNFRLTTSSILSVISDRFSGSFSEFAASISLLISSIPAFTFDLIVPLVSVMCAAAFYTIR